MSDHKKQEEPPKPKFKIIDRRRMDSDDEPPEVAKPAKTDQEATSKTSHKKPKEEAKKSEKKPETKLDDHAEEKKPSGTSDDPLGVINIGLSFLQTLSTVAWIDLGLVPHPQTQLIARKLDEARQCIAMFEAIYSLIKDDLPAEVNPEVLRLLQELKANYVNQLGSG